MLQVLQAVVAPAERTDQILCARKEDPYPVDGLVGQQEPACPWAYHCRVEQRVVVIPTPSPQQTATERRLLHPIVRVTPTVCLQNAVVGVHMDQAHPGDHRVLGLWYILRFKVPVPVRGLLAQERNGTCSPAVRVLEGYDVGGSGVVLCTPHGGPMHQAAIAVDHLCARHLRDYLEPFC
ncbi:MAG: hypothetical protein JKY23_00275 [Nitrospinaceae bacterium]|nr:hypothetical protein [Nitrospinaceae bacterium]